MTWMCSIRGYTYSGEDFTREADDYLCPLYGNGKEGSQQCNLATETTAATNQYSAVGEEKRKPDLHIEKGVITCVLSRCLIPLSCPYIACTPNQLSDAGTREGA